MKRKKGHVAATLTSIGFMMLCLYLIVAVSIQQSKIEDRPIGTSQTSILHAYESGQKAQFYVDTAADFAGKETSMVFGDVGGMLRDIHDDEFACSDLDGAPYWIKGNDSCIPDVDETIESIFIGEFLSYLRIHPTYNYPFSFLLNIERLEEGVSLSGRSLADLVINFEGGGKNGFSQESRRILEPDYEGALVSLELNYGSRGASSISEIVLHYTVSSSALSTINLLSRTKNSYHYIIDKDGKVYQTVLEQNAAQHAGCSKQCAAGSLQCIETCLMPGMNQKSIGISFVNCGFDTSCQKEPIVCEEGFENCFEPYTQEQIDATVSLLTDIGRRNPSLLVDGKLVSERVLDHSQINLEKEGLGPAFAKHIDSILQLVNEGLDDVGRPPITGNVVLGNEKIGNSITGFATTPSSGTLSRLASHESTINAYAAQRGLDPAILKALIVHESRAKADASNDWNALGLMQVVPFKPSGTLVNHQKCVDSCGFKEAATLAELDRDEYFDPEKNICCGSAIFLENTARKPIQWDCCFYDYEHRKEICVHEYYTTPYEKAARYYNGAGCAGAPDPDYVETVMELYGFFEGNPFYYTTSGEGQFIGSYKMPLSFETVLDIDVDFFDSVTLFSHEVKEECIDNLDECVASKVLEFGDLSLECSESPLFYEFLQSYLGCLEVGNESVCSFKLSNQIIEKPFSIHLSHDGIFEIPRHARAVFDDLPVNYFLRNGNTFSGELLFRFGTDGMMQVLIDGEEEFSVSYNEYDFFFEKQVDGTLVYSLTPLDYEFTPLINDFILCSEDHGLQFAFDLADRTPVHTSDIIGRFDNASDTYEVFFKPVISYEDEKDIVDVSEYMVFCADTPYGPPYINVIGPDTWSMSLEHENGVFLVDTYRDIEYIGVNVDRCGSGNLLDEVFVTVLSRDTYGKYRNDGEYIVLELNKEMRSDLSMEVTRLEGEVLVYNEG